MQQQISQRFMDVKAMAQYLSLSQDTIRAWVKTGRIPFSKLGRAVRFDTCSIEEWLKEKECKCIG